MDTILRLPDVMEITKLGKTTIYRMMKDGIFPQPIKISAARCSGWLSSEIEAFIQRQADMRQGGSNEQ